MSIKSGNKPNPNLFDWLLIGIGVLLIVSALFHPGHGPRSVLDPVLEGYAEEFLLTLIVGAVLFTGIFCFLDIKYGKYYDWERIDYSSERPMPEWIRPYAAPVLMFLARSIHMAWASGCIFIIFLMPLTTAGEILGLGIFVEPRFIFAGILTLLFGLTGTGHLPRFITTYIAIYQSLTIAAMGFGRKFRELPPENQAEVRSIWGPSIERHGLWTVIDSILVLAGLALAYLSFQALPQDFTYKVMAVPITIFGVAAMNIVFVKIVRIPAKAIARLLDSPDVAVRYGITEEETAIAVTLGMFAFMFISSWMFFAIALNSVSEAYSSILLSLGIGLIVSRSMPAHVLKKSVIFGQLTRNAFETGKKDRERKKSKNKKS